MDLSLQNPHPHHINTIERLKVNMIGEDALGFCDKKEKKERKCRNPRFYFILVMIFTILFLYILHDNNPG
jgi:hypothetical protein